MLTYDDGVLAVCDLVNISPPGAMPVQQLQKKSEHFGLWPAVCGHGGE